MVQRTFELDENLAPFSDIKIAVLSKINDMK